MELGRLLVTSISGVSSISRSVQANLGEQLALRIRFVIFWRSCSWDLTSGVASFLRRVAAELEYLNPQSR